MEEKLRGLQARAIALGRSMQDLKDRRDRGRIDEGRYADLWTDLERERIEILLSVQALLQGRDERIDEIIRDAIGNEDEDVLMDRLAKVAETKGLGARIVDGLNKHKGTIVSWLVEVGLQIARRAS